MQLVFLGNVCHCQSDSPSSLADLIPELWTLWASSALTQWLHLPPGLAPRLNISIQIQENQIFLCVYSLEIYFFVCRVFLAFLNHSYNLCQFCSLQFLCFARTTQNKVKSWIGQHNATNRLSPKSQLNKSPILHENLKSYMFWCLELIRKTMARRHISRCSQGRRAEDAETRQWRDLTSEPDMWLGSGLFIGSLEIFTCHGPGLPQVSLCWGN